MAVVIFRIFFSVFSSFFSFFLFFFCYISLWVGDRAWIGLNSVFFFRSSVPGCSIFNLFALVLRFNAVKRVLIGVLGREFESVIGFLGPGLGSYLFATFWTFLRRVSLCPASIAWRFLPSSLMLNGEVDLYFALRFIWIIMFRIMRHDQNSLVPLLCCSDASGPRTGCLSCVANSVAKSEGAALSCGCSSA